MLRLRRGLTIANKSFETNRIRNIQSSNSKFLDCIRTIPQIRRQPKHELNGERIQRVLELLRFVTFHCVKNRRNRYLLSVHYRFTGRTPAGSAVRIKKKSPKGKIVLKKKETKQKKKIGTKKQEKASPGVEPGLSECASNSLTTAP